MPDPAIDTIRKRSAMAFGQSYRLEVMVAIAESDERRISLSDIAQALGVPASSIQKPLRALVDLGLLTESADSSTRKKYYVRNESSGWTFAYELSGLKRGRGLAALRKLRPEP